MPNNQGNDTKASQNDYLTVEMFNRGISEVTTEIREVRFETQLNRAKIEIMQHSIYLGFAIMAFVVAYVVIFKPERSEKKEPELTTAKVQTMIDEAIARALVTK